MEDRARERIQLFADALALALHDRTLELEGIPITYYYDADVICATVLGFEAESVMLRAPAEKLLVRALLSCGFLGKFHILRSHSAELDEVIRRQSQQHERRDRAAYIDKAGHFLRSKGIWDTMSRLDSVVKKSEDSLALNDVDKLERFLSILRENPGETFAYIESVNGTWWTRLKRYLDSELLCLERPGPEVGELIREHEEALKKINRVLLARRPHYTESVFQDALALTALHRKIKEKDQGKTEELVRFYTETSVMQQEIREHPDLRQLLSYETIVTDAAHMPTGAQLVLRDSHYFAMRAWFEELAPGNNNTGEAVLTELRELSEKLQRLPQEPLWYIEKALAEIGPHGKELSELVAEFEKLAITDSIWTSGRIPKEMRQLEVLKRWTEVFEFAEARTTEEALFGQITAARTQLESRISNARIWTQDFRQIRKEVEEAGKRLRGKIEDPMRDLGLVRWGYELTPAQLDDLSRMLDALLLVEQVDLNMESARIAARLELARQDPGECQLLCAVLWAIGWYSGIVKLIHDLGQRIPDREIPASLQVIRAAANARTGILLSPPRRREAVDWIWNFQSHVPTQQRPGILLGVGYVLYHAWKLDTIGASVLTDNAEERKAQSKNWAEKCFQLGEEASMTYPENGLAWAYSINHCAYVGIMAEIELDKTERYFKTLIRLQELPQIWNARFADTVGTYYLLQAERIWERTPQEKKAFLDLSRQLKTAREYFDEAKKLDIGDIDINEHINRLDMLERKYQEIKDIERGNEEAG